PVVRVNGKKFPFKTTVNCYAIVEREWKNGDAVTLTLPMRVTVKRWAKNGNAASVNYGPLTFSLAIKEEWKQYGKNENWPEWEVLPKSDWNYGLVFDEKKPEKSFDVERKRDALPRNPFTRETTPVVLKAKAEKIPNWQADKFAMVGKLQPSPVKSNGKSETVTLIPMGAARLRITTFPVIGKGTEA